jgi:hypothetical protein
MLKGGKAIELQVRILSLLLRRCACWHVVPAAGAAAAAVLLAVLLALQGSAEAAQSSCQPVMPALLAGGAGGGHRGGGRRVHQLGGRRGRGQRPGQDWPLLRQALPERQAGPDHPDGRWQGVGGGAAGPERARAAGQVGGWLAVVADWLCMEARLLQLGWRTVRGRTPDQAPLWLGLPQVPEQHDAGPAQERQPAGWGLLLDDAEPHACAAARAPSSACRGMLLCSPAACLPAPACPPCRRARGLACAGPAGHPGRAAVRLQEQDGLRGGVLRAGAQRGRWSPRLAGVAWWYTTTPGPPDTANANALARRRPPTTCASSGACWTRRAASTSRSSPRSSPRLGCITTTASSRWVGEVGPVGLAAAARDVLLAPDLAQRAGAALGWRWAGAGPLGLAI